MDPIYVAAINTSEIIERNSIEELAAIPHMKILFKKELHKETTNSFGKKIYYYKYTPVDSKGNKMIVDLGEFEITEISPEGINILEIAGEKKYLVVKDIFVFDKLKSVTNIYKSFTVGDKFITDEMPRIINTLKKTQDWDLFLSISKIPQLEAEIVTLKEKVRKQHDTIMKSMIAKK